MLRCAPRLAVLAATHAAVLSCLVAAPSSARLSTAAAADSAFAHHQWANAARGYEAVLKSDPHNLRAWYRLASVSTELGHFERAAAAWNGAGDAGLPGVIAYYNAACAWARAGKPDSAFALLGRLTAIGYRQPDQLEQDADLAGVRGDARFAAVVEQARRNQTPCAFQPESRQLDFWIGDWDVTDNLHGNGPAGTSHVEAILGQCVIFENWSGRMGGHGKSFNAWNATHHCWQQNWMDDSGTVTNYSNGQFENDRMQFIAEPNPAQPDRTRRLSFTRLGPDHVRQVFDHSTDGGKTWVIDTDLDYVRHK